MESLVSFINMFLSYFIVFAVFIAGIAVAVFCGITLRKIKDKKDAVSNDSTMQ